MKKTFGLVISAVVWLIAMLLLAIPKNGIIAVIAVLIGAHCFSLMLIGFGGYLDRNL